LVDEDDSLVGPFPLPETPNAMRSLFWIGLLPSLIVGEPTRATPPNIVLIVADDLGINDLGCYGRTEHSTPHLDQLAADGARYTNAYVAQPICSASRAAILTGLHPARLHLTNFLPGRPDTPSQKLLQPIIEGQLPLEEVTLAEVLQSAGYATGMVGKWHLGGEAFGPKKQGFQFASILPENADPSSSAGGKNEFAIAQAASSFIREHQKGPFFCYIAHHSPHIRLAATPEQVARHRQAFHPTYAAMIESLDAACGEVLATIDQLGLRETTLVLFTSDNGGLHVLESPGTPATHHTPFRAGKGYLYEGGLRVPLIVRGLEHYPQGTTVPSPVSLMDLMPSLMVRVGMAPAQRLGPLDGEPTLFQPSPLPRTFYWHFPHYTNQGGQPAAAIRQGAWKLIEHFEDGTRELFRLDDDPSESTNRLDRHPDVAKTLTDHLHDWQRRVGAQTMLPNPHFDPNMHRPLYVDAVPSKLVAGPTAEQTSLAWKNWRLAMNAATLGQRARITPAAGDVRLLARDAKLHGQNLRYEDAPNKNVLGYWTRSDDWAEWSLNVPSPGLYEVEVQVGCGTGSGGAKVRIEVGGESLEWQVVETGHFQSMILQKVGEVPLAAGPQTLAVRPETKPGPAVMDLRRVVLRPVPATDRTK
jgi:arylsulfatase A-like enzyme